MGLVVRLKALGDNTTIATPPYVEPATQEWAGEFSPISWSIKRQQDNTGSWEFTIPAVVRFASKIKNYAMAYFYLDGEELIHGLVDDVQLDISGDKLIFAVTGLGEVAELDRVLSQNFAHYYDTEVIAILQEILRWAGWQLGDFSTMETPTIKTTIDLREQETVLQQVQRVCEAIPGLHWRWGGYDCLNRPLLDIGFFDEVQNVKLVQTEIPSIITRNNTTIGYVKSGQIRQTYTNLVSEVHGNGGTYNLTADPDKQRVMNLWFVNELITAFPAVENPDYPIILDGNGFFRIRNNNLYPAGSSIRKTWDFMVTKNEDPPSVADLTQAALGLYLKCIRFLQEHAYANDAYSLSVSGLSAMPLPGDRVNVSVNNLSYIIPGKGAATIEGYTLEGNYRIISWDMKGSGDIIDYSVNLTEHEYIGYMEEDEDVVAQKKNYENSNIRPRAGGEICGDYAIQVEQDNETDTAGPAAAADCYLCSESTQDAKEVTVAFSVPVGGMSKVKLIGIVPTPTVPFTYTITQQPTLTGGGAMDDPLIICFRFEDHVWDLADSVSIKTHFRYWG